MIDHGSHRSVYANLRAPEVAVGDLVETGALLGAVLDLGNGKGAVAHLEIWDASGSSPDNPLGWIAR
jgi:murein DD-endopeptidase MepM/ murein hydrolase activator NlpD